MNKERIMIFIDGSNFYYSTAKIGKRIDFKRLLKELTGNGKLVDAYYYVAPLDIKEDAKKYWSHQRFINMLKKIPKLNVVLCSLKKIKSDEGGFAWFVKGDDVKLSNCLLMGVFDNLYDTAIIVSGDEDFVDSVNIVRKRFNKKVGNAHFSRSSSSNLRKSCDFTINLNKIMGRIISEKEI